MNAQDFRIWLAVMDWSQNKAAKELGVHSSTIEQWLKKGKIDKRTALACAAIYNAKDPWPHGTKFEANRSES
jgi:transposase